MDQRMFPKAPLIALICAVNFVGFHYLSASENDAREYAFSTNATVEVLTITSSGGAARSKHTLWGDGRLVYQPRNPKEPTREARLTYTEMDDIVRALVDGGIMDWDDEDVFRRLREAGAGGGWTDLPTVRVTVTLDHYRNAAGEAAPATKEISFDWSPALIKHYSPDAVVPEVEALDFVQSRLTALLSETVEGE